MTGVYQITHMMIFTSTDRSNYLKITKNPDGPTITFKVQGFSTIQCLYDLEILSM